MKVCPKCEAIHDKPGTFCSRKCANSRNWSPVDKEKKSVAATNSDKVIKANQSRRVTQAKKKCIMCGNIFYTKYVYKGGKTCSLKCHSLYRSKTLKGKSGGYRQGSGRSIGGYYKGIYCASTYELAYVVYEDAQGRIPTRFPGYITDGNLKYYPDFIKDGGIVEIKGYHTDLVDRKKELAESLGYRIDILYKNDLLHCFTYISDVMKIKDITSLYNT